MQSGTRYAFGGDSIYQNETSITSGLTDAQWSAINYNAYNETTEQIFALNGTDRKRIEGTTVSEWGIEAPDTAPTLAVGASTGLTGDYNVRYTYARLSGTTVIHESNPSPAGTAVTLSDESLDITWTASTDSQVTHVRIYRTLTSGSAYFLLTSVAIGTTTLDDGTADGSLGAAIETDNDRPLAGTYVAGPAYDGTCFLIKDNLLYYSKAKRPESWPAANFIEVSTPEFPGKNIVFHNGQPYYLTKNAIYYIQGTGSTTFFPIPMKSRTGSQGIFGALAVDGHGIYHTGPDGLYLWSGNDKKITESRFEPVFRGETVNGIPGVSDKLANAWLHQYGNYLYLGYTSATYPTNILIFNLTTGRTSYYVYNDGSDIQIRCLANDETNNRLLIGDHTGFVRRIEDTSVTTDSGTVISWEAQSKDFTLQTRAHFPRWIKYDVDASLSTSCTGEILLNDTSHQSHTITANRSIKRRLIGEGNGSRAKIKLSGSGPISIYAVESS